MMQDFLSLKTDPTLLKAVDLAVKKGLTPTERQEQRVSFVYGSIRNDSSVTKEHVRELILQQQGVSGARSR